MAATRLFEAINISCMRGGRVLFQNVSFDLAAGDIAHLSGPNGAGKTSLLRIIAGALPSAAGKLKWQGVDYLKNKSNDTAQVFSYLPSDDASLKVQETALENLRFWAGIYDADMNICDVALEKMELHNLADTPVKFLSAGQRRRLSIARVFLRQDAKLWLLDEPLNGLDLRSYDLFIKALHEHTSNGGCAAIASHFTIEPPKKGKLKRIDVGYRA